MDLSVYSGACAEWKKIPTNSFWVFEAVSKYFIFALNYISEYALYEYISCLVLIPLECSEK